MPSPVVLYEVVSLFFAIAAVCALLLFWGIRSGIKDCARTLNAIRSDINLNRNQQNQRPTSYLDAYQLDQLTAHLYRIEQAVDGEHESNRLQNIRESEVGWNQKFSLKTYDEPLENGDDNHSSGP